MTDPDTFYAPIYEQIDPNSPIASLVSDDIFSGKLNSLITQHKDFSWLSPISNAIDQFQRNDNKSLSLLYQEANSYKKQYALYCQHILKPLAICLAQQIYSTKGTSFDTNEITISFLKNKSFTITDRQHNILATLQLNQLPSSIKKHVLFHHHKLTNFLFSISVQSPNTPINHIQLSLNGLNATKLIKITEQLEPSLALTTTLSPYYFDPNDSLWWPYSKEPSVLKFAKSLFNDSASIRPIVEKTFTWQLDRLIIIQGTHTQSNEPMILGEFLKNGRKAHLLDAQIHTFLITNHTKQAKLIAFETKNQPHTRSDVIHFIDQHIKSNQPKKLSIHDAQRLYYGIQGFLYNFTTDQFDPRFNCLDEPITPYRENRIAGFSVIQDYQNILMAIDTTKNSPEYFKAPMHKIAL